MFIAGLEISKQRRHPVDVTSSKQIVFGSEVKNFVNSLPCQVGYAATNKRRIPTPAGALS